MTNHDRGHEESERAPGREKDDWATVEATYHRAVEFTAVEREALLRRIESSDPMLAARVRQLLDARESAPEFLDRPILDQPEDAGLNTPVGEGSIADFFFGSSKSPDLPTIGRYQVLDEIGRGGMGVVYHAIDPTLGRSVAIKVLADHLRDDPENLAQFEREARTLAAIDHPNIATVFSLEEADGHRFFSMERIRGQTLSDRLERGAFPAVDAVRVALGVARGLEAAHVAGIAHGDLKPSNVILAEGERVKLVDFGLAVVATDRETAARYGTLPYLSPARLSGRPAEPVDDLWSFGVLMLEVLSGGYDGACLADEEPASWESEIRQVPAALVALLRTLLDRDPSRRTDATAVRRRLEELRLRDELVDRVGVAPEVEPLDLPRFIDSFVGRDDASARLIELLDRDTSVIALVGSAGCGKTRLAVEVARAVAESYDGVAFADLSKARLRSEILPIVLRALPVPERTDRVSEQIEDYLRSQRGLVILDNCEHVLDHVREFVEEWTRDSLRSRLVLTSRVVPSIRGERTLEVTPLALPDEASNGEDTLAIAELETIAAVRLFLDRADLDIRDAPVRSLIEICRRLDGNPLALELAASRADVLTLEDLESRLDSRFEVLVRAPGASGAERHADLRSLIDWSYELLSGPDRELLERLSVFSGSFDLEAVAAVCTDESIREWEVLDRLSTLVRSSLVRAHAATSAQGKSRFALLETIREYARDKLRRSDALDHYRRRHRRYYRDLATIIDQKIGGPDVKRWFEHADLDYPNFLRALEPVDESDEEQHEQMDLGVALGRYLLLEGRSQSGLEMLSGLLALPAAQESTARRGHLLASSARLLFRLGDYDEAEVRHSEEREIFERLGLAKPQSFALNALALIAFMRGDLERARELDEAALAIQRTLVEPGAVLMSLTNLGRLATAQHQYQAAIEYHREALAARREMGAGWGIAISLVNLGMCHFELGELDEARRHFEESLELHRSSTDRRGEGYALANLAMVDVAEGSPDVGRSRLEEAIALFRELGERKGLAEGLLNFVSCCVEAGDLPAAQAVVDESCRVADEVGQPELLAGSRLAAGRLQLARGDCETAESKLREAARTYETMPHPRGLANAIRHLGAVSMERGDHSRALRQLLAAHRVLERVGLDFLSFERDDFDRALGLCRELAGPGPGETEADVSWDEL